MDELDFVKELIARIPTRRDQAFQPRKIMFGSAVMGAALAFFGWKRPCCTGCEQTAAVGP